VPMTGSETDGRVDAQAPTGRQAASGRLLRRLGWSMLAACGCAGLLFGIGFAWFVWRLPAEEVTLARSADGIVVLTGGASRISDAIELLAAGRGRRLLISGANRATNSSEISRLNPEFEQVVRCCVDFDRSLNTLGNAIETRRWTEGLGFHSLIVVTSNYHMPRALAEIANQLPDVALVPFPVVSDRLRVEPWWANSATMRLMFSEYLKYILAHIRIRVHSAVAAGKPLDLARAIG
jgi:uncharacterized SAM-binding protein YcdF (DUF218 family)